MALRPLPIHCLSNKPGNAHRKMLTCGFCFVGCLLCRINDSTEAPPFVKQNSRRVACHHHLGSNLMSSFFSLFMCCREEERRWLREELAGLKQLDIVHLQSQCPSWTEAPKANASTFSRPHAGKLSKNVT